MAINKELLEIIACPKCKGGLIYIEAGSVLICEECRLGYPVKEDIPCLLIDEAVPR